MPCQNCGAEVDPSATFCHACGARLDEQNSASNPKDFTAGNPLKSKLAPRGLPDDDSEEELWQGGYSPKAMLGAWILAAIASVAILVVGGMFISHPLTWPVLIGVVVAIWAVLGLRLLAKRLGIHYRLTNHRFFFREGILSRVTERVEVIDIRDITHSQGLIERMVNVGSIHIVSSDTTSPDLWLRGIENPQVVSDLLDKARRLERSRRGLHIEHI